MNIYNKIKSTNMIEIKKSKPLFESSKKDTNEEMIQYREYLVRYKEELRKNIINHLTDQGTYDSVVDDIYVTMVVDNIIYSLECKKDIEINGLFVDTISSTGQYVKKSNPAYSLYLQAIKIVKDMSSRLGIHRKDRIVLHLEETEKTDDFDERFNI